MPENIANQPFVIGSGAMIVISCLSGYGQRMTRLRRTNQHFVLVSSIANSQPNGPEAWRGVMPNMAEALPSLAEAPPSDPGFCQAWQRLRRTIRGFAAASEARRAGFTAA